MSVTADKLHNLLDERKLEEYHKLGGVSEIARQLGTDLKAGLPASDDLAARRAKYGANVIPSPPPKTLLSLIIDGLQDKTLILLMVSAIVSLILGIAENPSSGWIEGTAILAAVFIVVCVSSGNDYQKERQFRALNDKKNNKDVKVIRGGEARSVSVYDVLVGDVVSIGTGDILCADGLVINSNNIKCDESTMTGELKHIVKGNEDPFLISSTMVVEGTGEMVVVCVGTKSQAGANLLLLQRPAEDTPLQEKLEGLADQIAKFGMGAAALILVSLSVKLAIQIHLGYQAFDASIFSIVLKYIITSITIVVVAVPEGLPLAVTIALAYSMKKMLRDNNLVRKLVACETMGGATTICSDKTGTLTKNQMTVMKMLASGKRFDDMKKLPISPEFSHLFELVVAVNSTAQERLNDKDIKVFVGSQTECALLRLCKDFKSDYEKLRADNPIVQQIPFSSERKRMSTIIHQTGKPFLLAHKGASEIVLSLCDDFIDFEGKKTPLSSEMREFLQRNIESFAEDGLRTLTLAFREFPEAPKVWEEQENHMTLLAIVGIKDPVRDEVPPAVAQCKKAGIVVRMVTGDNVVTATKIAKECGLLTDDGIVIEGPVFRKLPAEEMRKTAAKLNVMARSSPTDKLILVKTLKELGHVVAVTGDGTNDAPALSESNVGFSMGITGTDVAKEASAIILMDDNFASIVKAVMWGRNVYDSIRKFLQFQLTVNMVAVLLAFIGALTNSHGEAPLKPVQLLWVNLIMDTMAALALATEEPTAALLDRKPYGKDDTLITPLMWRSVITQGLYQLGLNLFILYYGHLLFGVEKESIAHLTIVFNIFVLCQVFNEINSRKLNGEINVFSGFFTNQVFLGVMFFTIGMQYLIIQFGGTFAGTTPLNLHQWLMCLGFAAFGIVLAFLVKIFVPISTKEPEKKPTPTVGATSSALGRAGWQKVRDKQLQLRAISTFRAQLGMASKLRRVHRVDAVGFSKIGLDSVVAGALKKTN